MGILQGSLEGAGYGRRFETGENYLQLRGLPWVGIRWTFTAGDFRLTPALVPLRFGNAFYPDLSARGIRVEAGSEKQQFSLFWGRETLLEGPRVPFRVLAPQSVLGATVRRKLGRLEIGVRWLRFASNGAAGDLLGPLLLPGQAFRVAETASVQAAYKLGAFRIFGEASKSGSDENTSAATSSAAGAEWETRRVTARLSWVRQGVLYFPAAGYFAGNRAGPFAELRVRPWKRLELFGSANRYRSNLERNPELPFLRSSSASGGATMRLPGAFTGTAQLSTLRYSSVEAGTEGPPLLSKNRQLSAALARAFRRHTVRYTERRMKMLTGGTRQDQTSRELEESVQWKRVFVSAAARHQQMLGTDRRNTLFGRTAVQAHFGRFSASAQIEIGSDLLNRTVFATSTYRTTALGVAARLSRTWDLQCEVFRNRMTMDLNPTSIFVLEGAGTGVPVFLPGLDQWSAFFRLRKQIHWGRALPAEALDQALGSLVPLVGTVEGFVGEMTDSQTVPAGGVPVTLDGSRTVTSDSEGRFRFSEVPEGRHRVALSTTELPAEFDPGNEREIGITVQPRRIARADLRVVRLGTATGQVSGPTGAVLEGITIRLAPSNRYTSTDAEGSFAFYNLRPGLYEVVLDAGTLPEGTEMDGPGKFTLDVRAGAEAPETRFRVRLRAREKPVRRIELP